MKSSFPQGLLHLPRDVNARAVVCSHAAARLEERGEYQQAVVTLGPFWEGPGRPLRIEGLNAEAAAHVLLRAGSLTAWLGSQRQLDGWQESAKDLLSRSATLFSESGSLGVVEAEKHLGLCYWRQGAFGEARVMFCQALDRTQTGSELWAALQLDIGLVEFSESKYQDCLSIYTNMAEAMEKCSDLTRGRFHNGLGITLRKLGEHDRAIVEMTAAAYYFSRAQHVRFEIATEINLGNLLRDARRFHDAHSHLDQAERLGQRLSDGVHLAHAKHSRAETYLAEGRAPDAELAARQSVAILEKGDEYALLIDSLTVHARSLAALEDSKALGVYIRAYELAADKVGGEKASAVAVEMFGVIAGEVALSGHENFASMMSAFEASMIKTALQKTSGKITEAAQRLGIPQTTLSSVLQMRHRDLQPKPGRKRRQVRVIKPAVARSAKS